MHVGRQAHRDLLGAGDQEGFLGCREQETRPKKWTFLGHGHESTCPKGPTFWSAEKHRRLANRPPGRLLLQEVARPGWTRAIVVQACGIGH